MGEDVGADGGVFKTNIGLSEKYGPERGPQHADLRERVPRRRPRHEPRRDATRSSRSCSPTSCRRPATPSSTSCPKYRYMSGGQTSVPVTVRVDRRRRRGDSARSTRATGESWFMHLPGLRVVTASSPGSAYSLLRAAIDDPNPTLFYRAQGPVRAARDRSSAARSPRSGRPQVVRPGSDVTIVDDAPDGRARPGRGRAARGRRASTPRSSTSAGSARSTSRPSGPRSRRPAGSSSPRSRSMPPAGARRSSAS